VDKHDKVGLGLLIKYHSPHKFAFPNYNLGLVVRDDLGAAQVQVLVSGNKKQWWNKEDVEVVVNETR
jgi:hypothetical protein